MTWSIGRLICDAARFADAVTAQIFPPPREVEWARTDAYRSNLTAKVCRAHREKVCIICDEDSDALWIHPADGAEQLTEREAAEEVSEPRPPGFYTMMDPEWADLHYGFPYPPQDKEHHIASDGGEWVLNNLGGGEWDAITYPPTGDPYFGVKASERAEALADRTSDTGEIDDFVSDPIPDGPAHIIGKDVFWPSQQTGDELCGSIRQDAPNPYPCTRPLGHDGNHGRNGLVWPQIQLQKPEPQLTDDELVAVRGLIQERYEIDLQDAGSGRFADEDCVAWAAHRKTCPTNFAGAAASLDPNRRSESREDKQRDGLGLASASPVAPHTNSPAVTHTCPECGHPVHWNTGLTGWFHDDSNTIACDAVPHTDAPAERTAAGTGQAVTPPAACPSPERTACDTCGVIIPSSWWMVHEQAGHRKSCDPQQTSARSESLQPGIEAHACERYHEASIGGICLVCGRPRNEHGADARQQTSAHPPAPNSPAGASCGGPPAGQPTIAIADLRIAADLISAIGKPDDPRDFDYAALSERLRKAAETKPNNEK